MGENILLLLGSKGFPDKVAPGIVERALGLDLGRARVQIQPQTITHWVILGKSVNTHLPQFPHL